MVSATFFNFGTVSLVSSMALSSPAGVAALAKNVSIFFVTAAWAASAHATALSLPGKTREAKEPSASAPLSTCLKAGSTLRNLRSISLVGRREDCRLLALIDLRPHIILALGDSVFLCLQKPTTYRVICGQRAFY